MKMDMRVDASADSVARRTPTDADAAPHGGARSFLAARAGAGEAAGRPASLRMFERPRTARAAWQLTNSFVPYVTTLAVMYLMLRRQMPWWSTLPLAVLAAGFMV